MKRGNPRKGPPQPCTGLTARWCPRHGDCTCVYDTTWSADMEDPNCPLHGTMTTHAGQR